MRGPPRMPVRLGLALALGALASCFDDAFLIGALCARDSDCGRDDCCAGSRCRPYGADGNCDNFTGSQRPYEWAYTACRSDAECVVHGMPRCLVWSTASTGFCTDLCVDDDPLLCERPTNGLRATRMCVTIDEQSLCAIDCSSDPLCPGERSCLDGLCIPTATP